MDSINILQDREQNVDVRASDFIKDNYLKVRLFHIFNHPTEFMLREYAKRIIMYITGKEFNYLDLPNNESLGQIIPVKNILFGNSYGEKYKGVEINNFNFQSISIGKTKYYELTSLVETFFTLYENNKVLLNDLKINGNFKSYEYFLR